MNDSNKSEKQRYDKIKSTGKYLELDILIGKDLDVYEDKVGRMPVITTIMKSVGPEEIVYLYATLLSIIEYYEKEYPMECLAAKMLTDIKEIGIIETEFNCYNQED